MKKLNMLKLLVILTVVGLSGCVTTKAKESYMPASFMEAKLLNGAYFTPLKDKPFPIVMMITGPAIMPNDLTSTLLVGCFAVGEGYADLATERAMLRLVNVTCLDDRGKAHIDQAVQGFVQGEDGVIGVRGKLIEGKDFHLIEGKDFHEPPLIEVASGGKVTMVITQGVLLKKK